MMIPYFGGRSPIGLDIGPRTIIAVQLATNRLMRGAWRLEAAACLDRPAGADVLLKREEAARIARVLGRQGFSGRDVVAAVPHQQLVTSALELPPRSSGAPLAQLARMELSRAHRMDPASFEMACWEVAGPTRAAPGTHMVAVACRHADADELMDGLESSGLRVLALDARAWAIARASGPALQEDETLAAVLDFSDSAALLVVVHRGAPAYDRLLSEASLDHLRNSICTRLSVEPALADYILDNFRFEESSAGSASADLESPALVGGVGVVGLVGVDAAPIIAEHLDNLASELRTAFAYAEHRFEAQIKRVLVQGPGASLGSGCGAMLNGAVGSGSLQSRLSELVGVPAFILTPRDVLEIPPPPRMPPATESPSLLTAIGLAMHPAAAWRDGGGGGYS
jgi:Tfp pilus assembly PilM family ATPase